MMNMNSNVIKRIFIGLILITIGTLFLGSQLGFVTLNPGELAATYWPLFMIFAGIGGLLGQAKYHKQAGNSYMWNLFIIVLGFGFLARNLNLLDMSIGDYIKLLIPVFIILFGIRMMFRKERPAKQKPDYSNKYEYNYEYNYDNGPIPPPQYMGDETVHAPSGPEQVPIFDNEPVHNPTPPSTPTQKHGHTKNQYYNPSAENRSGFFGDLYLGHDYWELKPMNISHFIGDTIIDLTKAQIPVGDTKLNISAFIGDVKVFVPNDMDVEVSVTSSSFLGDSTVFNKRENGFMRSLKEESHTFVMSDKKIRLQVNLFIGDITVQRVG
jgi:lia operon protein LiaF